MKWAWLLVALLALESGAVAQETTDEKRLPEELAITRSVVMQDADELESTAGFSLFKQSDQKQYAATAEFEYGLTDRWEVDAELPCEFVNPNDRRSANGLGDAEVAVRYGVVPIGQKAVAISAGIGLGLPTGDRTHNLDEERVTAEPFFTASTWMGAFNAQLNCGWERAIGNGGDAPRDDFLYNAAILHPVHHCYLVLEGDGDSNRHATTYYVTPEVIWKPAKNLQLLIGVPIGVTRAAADYGIVASVTFEWENITHRGTDND